MTFKVDLRRTVFVSMKSFLTRRYFNKGRELLPNKQSLLAQQQKKMDFRLGIKTKVHLWPLIKNRHYIFFITLTKKMQGVWLKLGFKWDTGNPCTFWIINLKFSNQQTWSWKGQEKIRMQHKNIRKPMLLARAAYFLYFSGLHWRLCIRRQVFFQSWENCHGSLIQIKLHISNCGELQVWLIIV